jgi:polysaccharide pyruvyl transferase WcaK-like protein
MKIAVTHMSHDLNRGDFAILAATTGALRQYAPKASITAVSVELQDKDLLDIEETELTRTLGCSIVGTPTPSKRYFRGSTWRWILRLGWAEVVVRLARVFGRRAFALLPIDTRGFIEALSGADVVVAKGGSYLYAMGGARELVYLWRMLYPIRVAKIVSPRVVLLGVSLGELRSPGSRRLAKAVLRRGVELYVRERCSVNLACEQLGLPPDKVRIVPDLAFLTAAGVSSNEGRRAGAISDVTLGVTVRFHSFASGGAQEARERYVCAMADALRRLLDAGDAAEVVFVPQVDEDASLAREVGLRIGRPKQVDVVETRPDFDTLLTMYKNVDVLLGARLHSVILAAVVGVPAVHIVYEPSKSCGTLELLGMSEFGILYEDVTSERLVSLTRRIIEHRVEVSGALTARVAELRADVREAVAEMLSSQLESRASPPEVRTQADGCTKPARLHKTGRLH